MTFQRFKQLWDEIVPVTQSSDCVIHDTGSSDAVVDALILVANGDHSAFDGIQPLMSRR